ncbi:MAG: hypothetical protein CMF49_03345 [Legionellales bacterium]|nr:hypothetical protein [Legionellales bacterium]
MNDNINRKELINEAHNLGLLCNQNLTNTQLKALIRYHKIFTNNKIFSSTYNPTISYDLINICVHNDFISNLESYVNNISDNNYPTHLLFSIINHKKGAHRFQFFIDNLDDFKNGELPYIPYKIKYGDLLNTMLRDFKTPEQWLTYLKNKLILKEYTLDQIHQLSSSNDTSSLKQFQSKFIEQFKSQSLANSTAYKMIKIFYHHDSLKAFGFTNQQIINIAKINFGQKILSFININILKFKNFNLSCDDIYKIADTTNKKLGTKKVAFIVNYIDQKVDTIPNDFKNCAVVSELVDKINKQRVETTETVTSPPNKKRKLNHGDVSKIDDNPVHSPMTETIYNTATSENITHDTTDVSPLNNASTVDTDNPGYTTLPSGFFTTLFSLFNKNTSDSDQEKKDNLLLKEENFNIFNL